MDKKTLVVVVEDNWAIAELLRETIEDLLGCSAVLVADGNEAVDVVKTICPDLVLMDFDLPGLNGAQIYDRMKAEGCTRGIPVLFVSASEDLAELRLRGIHDYLQKPFDLDELLMRVEASIDHSPRNGHNGIGAGHSLTDGHLQ